jgi:hypothetical protein
LRDPLAKPLKHAPDYRSRIKDVAAEVTRLKPEDIQTFVDFLDKVCLHFSMTSYVPYYILFL